MSGYWIVKKPPHHKSNKSRAVSSILGMMLTLMVLPWSNAQPTRLRAVTIRTMIAEIDIYFSPLRNKVRCKGFIVW